MSCKCGKQFCFSCEGKWSSSHKCVFLKEEEKLEKASIPSAIYDVKAVDLGEEEKVEEPSTFFHEKLNQKLSACFPRADNVALTKCDCILKALSLIGYTISYMILILLWSCLCTCLFVLALPLFYIIYCIKVGYLLGMILQDNCSTYSGCCVRFCSVFLIIFAPVIIVLFAPIYFIIQLCQTKLTRNYFKFCCEGIIYPI